MILCINDVIRGRAKFYAMGGGTQGAGEVRWWWVYGIKKEDVIYVQPVSSKRMHNDIRGGGVVWEHKKKKDLIYEQSCVFPY